MTKEIMKSSWMSSSCARPNMKRICILIKFDQKDLETKEQILSYIDCIANISKHWASKYYNIDQDDT
jgi:hypothetical protein